MMKDCKITLEWIEGDEPKKRSLKLNLPNEEKEIVLMHIRAGFKAVYRSLLKHLGYSAGELAGLLSTQMLDKSRSEQREATEYLKKFFEENGLGR